MKVRYWKVTLNEPYCCYRSVILYKASPSITTWYVYIYNPPGDCVGIRVRWHFGRSPYPGTLRLRPRTLKKTWSGNTTRYQDATGYNISRPVANKLALHLPLVHVVGLHEVYDMVFDEHVVWVRKRNKNTTQIWNSNRFFMDNILEMPVFVRLWSVLHKSEYQFKCWKRRGASVGTAFQGYSPRHSVGLRNTAFNGWLSYSQ